MPLKTLSTLLMAASALALVTTAPAMAASELGYETAYGQYLVGKYATYSGDTGIAAEALMRATEADPDNARLRERAFVAAIMSGELDFAAEHPPTEGASRFARGVAAGVMSLKALRAGKEDQALKHIDTALELNAGDRSAQLLRPLILAANRQWDQAIDVGLIAELSPESDSRRDRLVVFLQAINQARLLEIKGRHKDAEAIYKLVCQPGAATVLFGPYYGAFLERRGRKDDARALYEQILTGTDDVLVRESLNALNGKGYRKPKKPTLRVIMADSLFMSATLYASDQQPELALVTARMAQYASPQNKDSVRVDDRTKLLAGQVLVKLRDRDSAQAEWDGVSPDSPYYAEAQLRSAWDLKEQGDLEGAYARFSELSETSPKDSDLLVERARILWEQKRSEDALKLMTDYIAVNGEADLSWQAWFALAIIYQDLGRWSDVEASVKKGLVLEPDSPELLNMLGYGYVDRNEKVVEGMDMIRKALDKSPRSGAIMDSLGWGYYRQGDYEQALIWIERAIGLEPADAEITEHLGDVYKALGRDIEAKYQWARVLTLEPTEAQIKSVETKIAAAETLEAKKMAEADARPVPKGKPLPKLRVPPK